MENIFLGSEQKSFAAGIGNHSINMFVSVMCEYVFMYMYVGYNIKEIRVVVNESFFFIVCKCSMCVCPLL